MANIKAIYPAPSSEYRTTRTWDVYVDGCSTAARVVSFSAEEGARTRAPTEDSKRLRLPFCAQRLAGKPPEPAGPAEPCVLGSPAAGSSCEGIGSLRFLKKWGRKLGTENERKKRAAPEPRAWGVWGRRRPLPDSLPRRVRTRGGTGVSRPELSWGPPVRLLPLQRRVLAPVSKGGRSPCGRRREYRSAPRRPAAGC